MLRWRTHHHAESDDCAGEWCG